MFIPREQPNRNKEMKISDSVLLGLFVRDNEKCNTSHQLEWYSILHPKCAGVIDPEGPE